ncbi:hypothetical protein HDU76_012323 [Blyttiomyces sp. JEL0837]|nr:hypothetical protein HDU76_012323 [Blyttiomyces sp. JEL0837]
MEAVTEKFEASAKNSSKVGSVVLKSGEKLPADVVIIGAGVVPKTDYLKGSGITLDRDQGITVDAHMQVPNVDGVFAIGDVARYPYHLTGESVRIEHWNVAQNQGRLAAENIALLAEGKPATKRFETVPFFWTAQYGKAIRYSGHAESFDDIVLQGSLEVDSISFVAFYGRKGKVLAVASVNKDPLASYASELIRVDKMPSIDQLRAGKDILTVALEGDKTYVHEKKSKKSEDDSLMPIIVGGIVLPLVLIGISLAYMAFIHREK